MSGEFCRRKAPPLFYRKEVIRPIASLGIYSEQQWAVAHGPRAQAGREL